MTLDRDRNPRGNNRRPPKSKFTIPIIVAVAVAVIVFVGIVLAVSGQSFF